MHVAIAIEERQLPAIYDRQPGLFFGSNTEVYPARRAYVLEATVNLEQREQELIDKLGLFNHIVWEPPARIQVDPLSLDGPLRTEKLYVFACQFNGKPFVVTEARRLADINNLQQHFLNALEQFKKLLSGHDGIHTERTTSFEVSQTGINFQRNVMPVAARPPAAPPPKPGLLSFLFGNKAPPPDLPPEDNDVRLSKKVHAEVVAQLRRADFISTDELVENTRLVLVRSAADDGVPLHPAIMHAFLECIRKLYDGEHLDEEPELPHDRLLTGVEGARFRDRMSLLMLKAADPAATRNAIYRAFVSSYLKFAAHLPQVAIERPTDEAPATLFSIPLVEVMKDVGSAVHDSIAPVFSELPPDLRLFSDFNTTITNNLLRVNKVTDPSQKYEASRLVYPSESKLPPREIVEGYLANTPFLGLFATSVPFDIPPLTRFEHMWLVSPPGTGKSTTLAALINRDLDLVARDKASVIVMESNRDLIKSIEGLKRFAPGGDLDGRLLTIDVEDVEWPVALNLFDIGLEELNTLSLRDREALLNSTVSMLDYVFRALLGAELTSRQSTLFNFTIQLLLHIPRSTLDTMIELMAPKGLSKFAQYVETLDKDAQLFFRLKFDSDEFKQTKNQVIDRLFAIKRIRALSRMFSAPKTKLNLYEEMGKGRVILINAAKSLLQEDGVEVFSRFFLAMILLAAEKRQLLAKEDRIATYVYIDEAQDVIRRDEKLPILLDQARKFRVAMILAHQRLDQMSPPVLNALYGSTAIKFAAQLSDANASALARNMGTTAEFILNQPQYSYAAHIRGLTPQAIALKVPFTDLNALPRMTAEEAEAVRADMRKRYSSYYTEIDKPELSDEQTITGEEGIELALQAGAKIGLRVITSDGKADPSVAQHRTTSSPLSSKAPPAPPVPKDDPLDPFGPFRSVPVIFAPSPPPPKRTEPASRPPASPMPRSEPEAGATPSSPPLPAHSDRPTVRSRSEPNRPGTKQPETDEASGDW